MLSVTNKPFILCHYSGCHYAECRGAVPGPMLQNVLRPYLANFRNKLDSPFLVEYLWVRPTGSPLWVASYSYAQRKAWLERTASLFPS
jgi:hypothetical protein